MRSITLALAGALLASCVVNGPIPKGSPEFQRGWVDGCASGYAAAGDPWSQFARDAQAYRADAEYSEGWDAARDQCRGQYEAIRR